MKKYTVIILFLILIFINLNTFKENFTSLNTIPKIIYLCYKTKNIPDYIIPTWKRLNPDYEIRLFDNNDCREFLRKNYDKKHLEVFDFLRDGPIKADFWRCCIIYKYGGVYCDIDVKPLKPINSFLENDTDFLTVRSGEEKHRLTPELIISKPKNELLKMCIDNYLKWKLENVKYEYWKYSITRIMSTNMEKLIPEKKKKQNKNVYFVNNKKYQLVNEIRNKKDIYDDYVEYNGKVILLNRYPDYDAKKHNFKNTNRFNY